MSFREEAKDLAKEAGREVATAGSKFLIKRFLVFWAERFPNGLLGRVLKKKPKTIDKAVDSFEDRVLKRAAEARERADRRKAGDRG